MGRKRAAALELVEFVHHGTDYVHDSATNVGYAIGALATVKGPNWTARVRTGRTTDQQVALASVAITCDDEHHGAGLTPQQLRDIPWTELLDLVTEAAVVPMRLEMVDGRAVVSFRSDDFAEFDDERRATAVRRSRRRAGIVPANKSDEVAKVRQLLAVAEALGVSGRQYVLKESGWSRATVDRLLKLIREQDAEQGAHQ